MKFLYPFKVLQDNLLTVLINYNLNMRIRYKYITLIKKWPKGVNRWEQADRQIAKLNHPDYKTLRQFQIRRINSDFQVTYLNDASTPIQIPQERNLEDDRKLVADISGLTLKQFIKDSFRKNTRKQQHTLPLYLMASFGLVILNLILYFGFEQYVDLKEIDLDPQTDYEYPVVLAEKELGDLRDKILICKKEYDALLQKARDNRL